MGNFTAAIQSSEVGLTAGNRNVTDYLTKRFGDVMTDGCIEMLIANRIPSRIAAPIQKLDTDLQAQGLQLTRRSGEREVYDFSAELRTPEGDLAATTYGNLTMEQEGDSWKASRITATVKEAAADLKEN